jgi:hypothetical protein
VPGWLLLSQAGSNICPNIHKGNKTRARPWNSGMSGGGGGGQLSNMMREREAEKRRRQCSEAVR